MQLRKPLRLLLLPALVSASPGLLVAAGMDTDTSRLKGSSFEKTSPTNRFTTPAGSTQLDNGMIIKWGQATVPALSSNTTVLFSTAYPSNILSVEVAVQGGALSGASATVNNVTKTGFTINIQCLALSGPIVCTSATTVRWSARGY